MDTYKCSICGYSYTTDVGDKENGIPEGTQWNELPENWSCPVCNLGKREFYREMKCERCV
ncbi:rubredoxin [Candidatus Electrothrix sp.]|uniref:rubredoxin n=1 Tax=Candidatus Electrothrix sp. TaxID=2170559 RepID=UPI0040575E97